MNAPSEAVYLPAAAVAAVCGLSLVTLDNRYRPDGWGAPRDFRAPRGVLLYREASLPVLVDALFAAGEPDAALRLRAWLAAIATKRPADASAADASAWQAVPHEEPTDAVLAAHDGRRARRHASDVEPSPFRDDDAL